MVYRSEMCKKCSSKWDEGSADVCERCRYVILGITSLVKRIEALEAMVSSNPGGVILND